MASLSLLTFLVAAVTGGALVTCKSPLVRDVGRLFVVVVVVVVVVAFVLLGFVVLDRLLAVEAVVVLVLWVLVEL